MVDEGDKTCPRCAETVKAAAKVCKHCGHEFEVITPVGVATPPPKPWGCLKTGAAIIGGFFLLLVVIAMFSKKPNAASSTDAASGSKPVAVAVTARDLEAAYAANEPQAQQQYGNQPLLVSGTIESIQLDFADKPYLVLRGNNFLGPQAHLGDDSQAKAGSLHKGQKIELLCQGVSEVVTVPMLSDCELQSN